MALTISLTVTKIDANTYSTAKTIAINPDNIKHLTTQASGVVDVTYYDEQRVKLTQITTTTNVNTIVAAMSGAKLINAYTIDSATLNKGMVINQNSIVGKIGSANPYDIRYNLGKEASVRKRKISAFVNSSTISEAITALSQSGKTFRVAGDKTTTFVAGQPFFVSGSTGNDKIYTVVSSAYTTYTTITVNETIPNSTADGDIVA